MTECVIWDWNGTLLDDVDLCVEALNWLLAQFGYPQRYDRAQYQGIFGFPIEDYYRRAGFDFSKDSFADLAERYMQFYIPHSRYTEVRADEIECVKDLRIVATSAMAGVYMVEDEERKRIFVTGHAEYARNTLHHEYQRDLAKGLHIHIPNNYYPSDDVTREPLMRWRSCANLLIGNWLCCYVASR